METNCPNHNDTIKVIERIQSDIREVVLATTALRERTAEIDQSVRSGHHRISDLSVRVDFLERSRDEITRLTTSIEALVQSVSGINSILEKYGTRLDCLERAGGKLAIAGWKIIGVSILSGFGGFIVALIVGRIG